MALIAELETKLTANTTNFNSGINSSLSSINGFLKGAAGLAVIGVTIHELGNLFRGLSSIISESTARVSELVDTSTRLGVGIPELQRLEYAAKLSGVSIESLHKSMGLLLKNVALAQGGNQALSDTFTKLKINVTEFAALGADKQYAALSEAIKTIKSPAEQALVAMQLLGRGGIQQLSLLKDDVAGMTAEFSKFGGELSTTQAKAIESYGDSITRVSTVWEGFQNQLTAAVAGPFKAFLDTVAEGIVKMGGIGEVAKLAGSYIVSAFQGGLSFIGGFLTALDAAIIKVEQLARLLLRLQQFATLGLSNLLSDSGGKIASLTKDINARQEAASAGTNLSSRVNQGLTGLQSRISQSATENAQNSKVEVTINAEEGLSAKVAKSTAINAQIIKQVRDYVSSSASSVGK